jgi:hypothetical protein
MGINYPHELYKYASIDFLKNGTVKIRFGKSTYHQANIFYKLGEFGYRCKTRNKFYLCGGVNKKDEDVYIYHLNDAFIDYLEQMDLAFFDGKLSNHDVMNAFITDNPIKRNDLIICMNGQIGLWNHEA